jgi:multidrug resistance efflux pump
MIKALRKRARPDNLVNQVRAGGKSMARRLYLIALSSVGVFLVFAVVGPLLFLDADGLVMKERSVISTDYNARVLEVHVRPGDEVKAGALLATVTSSETIDKIADLTAKVLAASNREATSRARIAQINALLPVARDRRTRARAAVRQVESLAARQLTTSMRMTEATRELYDAERDEAQMTGELATIQLDLNAAGASRKETAEALDAMKKAYNGGRIIAPVAGTVGSKVVSPGSVIRVGESALEIYRGDAYAVGYLPTNRMFNVDVGDRVIVTDGKTRSGARVIRVEAVADALPPEFQSVFSARERQQVVRLEMDGGRASEFSIHSKVKVTGLATPSNIISLVKTSFAFVTNSVAWVARTVTGGLIG